MPEIGTDILPSVKRILSKAAKLDRVEEVRRGVEEGGEEFVGWGGESIVILKKGCPEKVIAISYGEDRESPTEAKSDYYLHRVFSTLFPHNFPKFYASFGGEYAGTIRQKVEKAGKKRIFQKRLPTKYPFTKVERTCEELGIPLYFQVLPKNFIVGADGGEYYVDRLIGPKRYDWNITKIVGYMDSTGGFAEKDKRVVIRSIERLKGLSLR